ncbi:MAG: Stk1 family PASTA domain-containing Ser/Thr kinase, partial [Rubrobacteraceae bacterium]
MDRITVDNRYALSRFLGGGGMGKVYLAHDRDLDRDVALKVLREHYAEDEGFVERFEREAKSAASLNYPNVVAVYDRGRSEDGSYYIVMEYVSGGTLKDRILREGALDPDEAVRVGAQVADALGVAHGAGIVHLDIKPQNVLLTVSGDAKVGDFGIARAAEAAPLSDSGLVLGTANYMSPEQAMGDPVGPTSDLYSLGVVLYEMLTGELPFEADSAVGVAMKHVTEPPRPPGEVNPRVPGTLDALVMRLLAKRPGDRYGSAAELAGDLRRVAEGLPPVHAPVAGEAETQRLAAPAAFPGSPGGSRRGSFRRGSWILLALLAALVALLALAGLVLSRGPDGPLVGSLGRAAEEAGQALGVGRGEVPGVVGLEEKEARERLAEKGFGVSVERRKSAAEDEGKVLEQSVPGGEEVARGSRVALAVGDGPRIVEAPDLVGLTPEEAEDRLREAGLKPGDRKEAPSEKVPEGKISGQDPPAGEKTEADTEVDLVVSSGPPEIDQIDVPVVRCRSVEDAMAMLREAGCEVTGTRTEPSPRPVGTVVG